MQAEYISNSKFFAYFVEIYLFRWHFRNFCHLKIHGIM